MAMAPLVVVLLALEEFFGCFAPNVPSLTVPGLAYMAKVGPLWHIRQEE